MKMKSLKEYYSNKKVLSKILNSVTEPEHRVWKVQDVNGTFRQNKKKINTIRKLKQLIGNNPSKIYVSVARFLHPETCYGKTPKASQWKITDALFLGSELLFDLDSEDNLRQAHKDGIRIIQFMKTEGDYELLNIRYSGNKGFHLLYKDKNPVQESDPIKRIKKTEERRNNLIKAIEGLKTMDPLHMSISADQFRVHAVIGTIKAKTGHIVKEIPLKSFLSMSTKVIQKTYIRRAVRPIERPMIEDNILTSTTGKERPALSSYPLYYHFVDNIVKGTKNMYITVLKYKVGKKVDHIIRFIQEQYNLSNFYKFVYKGIQMYINLKLVSKERLLKIMRVAKPINLNSFLCYGHTWIPISETVDKSGNKVYNRAELVDILKSKNGMYDTHSRPHANLFNLKFQNMAGREQNRVCKAIVESG